jgi:hypothetical protein
VGGRRLLLYVFIEYIFYTISEILCSLKASMDHVNRPLDIVDLYKYYVIILVYEGHVAHVCVPFSLLVQEVCDVVASKIARDCRDGGGCNGAARDGGVRIIPQYAHEEPGGLPMLTEIELKATDAVFSEIDVMDTLIIPLRRPRRRMIGAMSTV